MFKNEYLEKIVPMYLGTDSPTTFLPGFPDSLVFGCICRIRCRLSPYLTSLPQASMDSSHPVVEFDVLAGFVPIAMILSSYNLWLPAFHLNFF